MIRNFLLILALFCCSFSCQQNASQVDAPEPEPLSVAEAIIQKLPPVEIHLTEITPAGLQAEIKKHQGKVVLVDFWALWCPMCLESFHHLSEWYLKYSEQGLVIITIDLDENNSDNRKFVTEYLTEQRAPFENFISTDGATQKAMRGLQNRWGRTASLPDL